MRLPPTIAGTRFIHFGEIRMFQQENGYPPFFARKLTVQHIDGDRIVTEEHWYHGESIEELQVHETPPRICPPLPLIDNSPCEQLVGDDPFA